MSDEDRLSYFGKTKGLHSSYDKTTRYEINLEVVEHQLRVETVTDWDTGKSLRADTLQFGPPNTQMTWSALNHFIQMPLSFAMPYHRYAAILGIFSDSQIYSAISNVTQEIFFPIYMHLGINISEASKVQMDDSPTQVLKFREKIQNNDYQVTKHSMIEELNNEFGLFFPLKKKLENKKKINISVLFAEFASQGPTIFYRTHVGSCGNLLSKILENRSPKKKGLLIQGDSSSENNIDAVLSMLESIQVGCGAHARRPFWRHRDDDDSLCDYMLYAFGLLAKVEDLILTKGGSASVTLKLRQKYSKKIWVAIKNKCESVVAAKKLKSNLGHFIWTKSSHFGIACNYIIKHYTELTVYLSHPELEWTNNICERLLRGEKLLLNASKFRKTELGRITLDILRTMVMTCRMNNVPLDQYMEFLYRNKNSLEEDPQNFTPQAFSLIINAKKDQSIAI